MVELREEEYRELHDGIVFDGCIKAVEGKEGRSFWFIFFGSGQLIFDSRRLEEGRLLIAEGKRAVVFPQDLEGQPSEIKNLFASTPEKILSLSGKNFFMNFNEIERVELKKTGFLEGPFFLTGQLTIITARQISDFYLPAEALDEAYRLCSSTLGEKAFLQ